MPRSMRLVFTKLADEPWFIDAAAKLRDLDNDAAYTITSVVDAWLEKRATTNPETWEAVTGLTIANEAIYRSGTMVGGTLTADEDADPPAGSNYRLIVECVITATAEYGGGNAGMVLEADVAITPNATTAPA